MNYKKELERRFQSQLAADLQRFRESELSEARAAEAQSFAEKLRQHQYKLDQLYGEKIKKLKEREKNALDLCKQVQQRAERQMFEARQVQLDKANKISLAETELRQRSIMENDVLREERERLGKLEQELKSKIWEYEQAKKTLHLNLEHDDEIRKMLTKKEQEVESQSLMKNARVNQKDLEIERKQRENL